MSAAPSLLRRKVPRNKRYIGSQDSVKRDEVIVTGSSMVNVETPRGTGHLGRQQLVRNAESGGVERAQQTDSGNGAGKARAGATNSSTASRSCAAAG